jgi:hypothetical protein
MLTLIAACTILALCALIVATLSWYWAVLAIACVVLAIQALIRIIDLPDAPSDRQTGAAAPSLPIEENTMTVYVLEHAIEHRYMEMLEGIAEDRHLDLSDPEQVMVASNLLNGMLLLDLAERMQRVA